MRSLIKAHRRSDSSTSDVASPPEITYSKHGSKTTPINSPLTPQHPHLTPPQISVAPPSALSSPKKLLTPIKKMFGHHNKSSITSGINTGDTLNSALFNEFVPPVGRKTFTRGPQSFSNLSELALPRSGDSYNLRCHQSSALLDYKMARASAILQPLPLPQALVSSSDSSVEVNKQTSIQSSEMPIIFDNTRSPIQRLGSSDTNLSITNSMGKFQAKLALSQECLADGFKVDTEAYYEDDDELKSDNSSQFSFVKDIRGGRNTSVKYYKTKSSVKPADGIRPNTFNVDDMGYEVEAFSDYDFENNGMDEEEGFDDFEGNNKYDDFLDDQELNNEAVPPPEDLLELHFRDETETQVLANLSFGGPHPEDPYSEDFLESYMDSGKLPYSDGTPCHFSLPFSADGSDGSPSPLISGVTFGSEMRFASRRSVRSGPSEPSEPEIDGRGLGISAPAVVPDTKRHSIINMMDLLSALEDKTQDENEKVDASKSIQDIKSLLSDLEKSAKPKEENKRNLVVNMMNTLAVLETSISETSPESKTTARKSIANMMSSLAALDLQNEARSKETETRSQTSDALTARYSWSNNDGLFKFNKPDSTQSTGYDELPTDYISNQLDEDLLDEVNQLPEDFDFEEHQSRLLVPSDSFRSNSYSKKPRKVMVDNNYQSNKIETSHKTVTFYRSNSGNSEQSKSRSVSRVGSTYSATSFTSVGDETYMEEHDKPRVRQSPYSLNLNPHLYEGSAESVSHRSFNLEPITESDSPQLK